MMWIKFFVTLLIYLPIEIMWLGFVYKEMFNWFVAPVFFPVGIDWFNSMGLVVFLSLMRYKSDDKEIDLLDMFRKLLAKIFGTAVFLVIGLTIHLIIGR